MAMRPRPNISLSSKKQEDDSDALFASLTVMAHASTPEPQPVPKKKVKLSQKRPDNPILAQLKSPKLPQMKSPRLVARRPSKVVKLVDRPVRRSEFFFRLSESFQQELHRRQKAIKVKARNPAMEALDQEVEARRKTYEQELPAGLQANIESVREFILKEIAPLMMAVSAGTRQAQEVMQRTLNTAVDERPLAQFELMVQSAGRMRMAKFITEYMGLEADKAEELLATVAPKKEMMIFHPGMVDEGRRTKQPPNAPAPQEAE